MDKFKGLKYKNPETFSERKYILKNKHTKSTATKDDSIKKELCDILRTMDDIAMLNLLDRYTLIRAILLHINHHTFSTTRSVFDQKYRCIILSVYQLNNLVLKICITRNCIVDKRSRQHFLDILKSDEQSNKTLFFFFTDYRIWEFYNLVEKEIHKIELFKLGDLSGSEEELKKLVAIISDIASQP